MTVTGLLAAALASPKTAKAVPVTTGESPAPLTGVTTGEPVRDARTVAS